MRTVDLTGSVIEPELGRQVLAELADLNAGFLRLAGGTESAVVPTQQRGEIQQLKKPALRRLAGCSFALFDLQLRDATLWRSLRQGQLPRAAQDVGITRQVASFTLAALMYLRHLAEVNRFLARLAFGASGSVLDAISKMPISRLREIADTCPDLLCGRFATQPAAWSDLVKLAGRNQSEPMLPAKFLGYQHLDQR